MFERHKLVSTAIVKTISLLVWHGASTIQIRSSTYKKKKDVVTNPQLQMW